MPRHIIHSRQGGPKPEAHQQRNGVCPAGGPPHSCDKDWQGMPTAMGVSPRFLRPGDVTQGGPAFASYLEEQILAAARMGAMEPYPGVQLGCLGLCCFAGTGSSPLGVCGELVLSLLLSKTKPHQELTSLVTCPLPTQVTGRGFGLSGSDDKDRSLQCTCCFPMSGVAGLCRQSPQVPRLAVSRWRR